MKVLTAELVTSAAATGPRPGALRPGIAQFAFAGRSNVGKSSLLNALVGRTLARTSAAAGKTRQANIYRIAVEGGTGGAGTWTTYFVDLPGYGYARGGDDAVEELAAVVNSYFSAASEVVAGAATAESGSQRLQTVFLLVDSRHPGLESDVQAHRWISDAVTAPIVIATKVDKLSGSERSKNLRAIEQVFGQPAIAVSAARGIGLDQIWKTIAGRSRNG